MSILYFTWSLIINYLLNIFQSYSPTTYPYPDCKLNLIKSHMSKRPRDDECNAESDDERDKRDVKSRCTEKKLRVDQKTDYEQAIELLLMMKLSQVCGVVDIVMDYNPAVYWQNAKFIIEYAFTHSYDDKDLMLLARDSNGEVIKFVEEDVVIDDRLKWFERIKQQKLVPHSTFVKVEFEGLRDECLISLELKNCKQFAMKDLFEICSRFGRDENKYNAFLCRHIDLKKLISIQVSTRLEVTIKIDAYHL